MIDHLGGISVLVRAPVHRYPSALQGWKARGVIWAQRHANVVAAALSLAPPLHRSDFLAARPTFARQGVARATGDAA